MAPRYRVPRPVRAAALLAAAGLAALAAAPPAAADAIRDREWQLAATGTDTAWKQTRGAGVTVAVLDTGVDAHHPDLAGQVLPGRSFVAGRARPGDADWGRHGTEMAALVAGHGHGPGRGDGVVGIAPAAKILPVRVILENGDKARRPDAGTPAPDTSADGGDALARGIRWAVDHGADVVNLSLGDDTPTAHPDPDEDAAVRYALAHNTVVVASAGNGGARGNRSSYPAAYPGVISAAAVDSAGRRADFSTHRWYTTLAAPGRNVVVTDPNGLYYEGWGTSAAAAITSGAAALVRARYPRLAPDQVRDALRDGARHRPAGGRSDTLGSGLLSVPGALAAAARMTPHAPLPAPAAAPTHRLGPAPEPAAPRTGGGSTLHAAAVPFTAAGGALLAAAGLLGLRRRRGFGDRPPDAVTSDA